MKSSIILIGPIGAGKSTLGKLLAEHLDMPACSMDDVRWSYYNEIGYSQERAREIGQSQGFEGVYRYWKPFEVHAVERVLAEHSNCVIDFGGGHSVHEDDDHFERVRRALEPYPDVVLVLPSPDHEESLRLLRTRGYNPKPGDFDVNRIFVTHHSNYSLAKIIVYTEGKTPDEARDEIVASLSR